MARNSNSNFCYTISLYNYSYNITLFKLIRCKFNYAKTCESLRVQTLMTSPVPLSQVTNVPVAHNRYTNPVVCGLVIVSNCLSEPTARPHHKRRPETNTGRGEPKLQHHPLSRCLCSRHWETGAGAVGDFLGDGHMFYA